MKLTFAFLLLLAVPLLPARASAGRRARSLAAGPAAPSSKEASAPEKKATEAKAPPKADKKDEPAAAPVSALRGPQRIDFDDRLVQGQTNKLGAVYLYQRKDPAQGSLLERRKSFREEIAKDLVE